MDEFVRVLKGLWSEGHFTMQGEFYRTDDATLPMKPVRAPHPPKDSRYHSGQSPHWIKESEHARGKAGSRRGLGALEVARASRAHRE